MTDHVRVGRLREAIIDTDAITQNVRTIRQAVGVDVIAVVKADGYGHGAVRSAHAALRGGATMLGVADADEALRLRTAGIDAPVLAWLHAPGQDFRDAVAARITLGVSSIDQLAAVAAAAPPGVTPTVHLKLETGLGRNGVAPEKWPEICAYAARLERSGQITVEGLFSHLSNTSRGEDLESLAAFRHGESTAEQAGLHPRMRHIAATQAALTIPETRLNAVRVGIGIYGLSPVPGKTSADLNLHPAMTLVATVAATRRVRPGHGVSYGYTYRTGRRTTLALIPIGYADGIPRQASNTGPLVIDGRRFTVSGRVAMDQFVVDVGDHPVTVGDQAIIFGDPAEGAPAAAEWAAAANTIDYDIVTRIGPRVRRREDSHPNRS